MSVEMQAVEDQFSAMAKQMGRWIDHVLGPNLKRYCSAEAWTPAINVYEDERSYFVVVDLAGVAGDLIDVRVEAGRLIFTGERVTPRPDHLDGSLRVHTMEIDHGPFCRAVELPPDVDSDQAPPAWYGKGLLWIRLPKKV